MNARCKDHPDAPHGYDHNGSHNAGRYVCVCEAWERDEGARMSEIERAQAQRDGLLKPMRPGNQAAGSGLARSEPVSGMSGIELPSPAGRLTECPDGWVNHGAAGYSAEQVRAAILAERERCARVCEELKVAAASYFEINDRLDEAAAAIRRGSV